MPAPDATLLAAMRNGQATRHVFVKLEHPDGDVLAWDGVGEYLFAGEVYSGVRGFAAVEGISDSRDLQTHAVTLRLMGVPPAHFRTSTANVRNEPVTIWAAWFGEDGVLLASLVLFKGKADFLRTKPSAFGLELEVVVRGKLASWSQSPRAYYTDSEQQSRYPGDVGFFLMPTFENRILSGWSLIPATTGSTPRTNPSYSGSDATTLIDEATLRRVGETSQGFNAYRSGSSILAYSTGAAYTEDTTGAALAFQTSAPFRLQLSGADCYTGEDGYIYTPNGKKITLGGSSALRLAANVVRANAGSQTAATKYLVRTVDNKLDSADNPVSNHQQVVHDAKLGHALYNSGANEIRNSVTGEAYVKQGTTTKVTTALDVGVRRPNVGAEWLRRAPNGLVTTDDGTPLVLASDNTYFLRYWTF